MSWVADPWDAWWKPFGSASSHGFTGITELGKPGCDEEKDKTVEMRECDSSTVSGAAGGDASSDWGGDSLVPRDIIWDRADALRKQHGDWLIIQAYSSREDEEQSELVDMIRSKDSNGREAMQQGGLDRVEELRKESSRIDSKEPVMYIPSITRQESYQNSIAANSSQLSGFRTEALKTTRGQTDTIDEPNPILITSSASATEASLHQPSLRSLPTPPERLCKDDVQGGKCAASGSVSFTQSNLTPVRSTETDTKKESAPTDHCKDGVHERNSAASGVVSLTHSTQTTARSIKTSTKKESAHSVVPPPGHSELNEENSFAPIQEADGKITCLNHETGESENALAFFQRDTIEMHGVTRNEEQTSQALVTETFSSLGTGEKESGAYLFQYLSIGSTGSLNSEVDKSRRDIAMDDGEGDSSQRLITKDDEQTSGQTQHNAISMGPSVSSVPLNSMRSEKSRVLGDEVESLFCDQPSVRAKLPVLPMPKPRAANRKGKAGS